jgi:hypothetical protein
MSVDPISEAPASWRAATAASGGSQTGGAGPVVPGTYSGLSIRCLEPVATLSRTA